MQFPRKRRRGGERTAGLVPTENCVHGPGIDAVVSWGRSQLQQHCSRLRAGGCRGAVPSSNCCVEAARCSRSRQERNCMLRNSPAVSQAAAVVFDANQEGSGRDTASIHSISISCSCAVPGFFVRLLLSFNFQVLAKQRQRAEVCLLCKTDGGLAPPSWAVPRRASKGRLQAMHDMMHGRGDRVNLTVGVVLFYKVSSMSSRCTPKLPGPAQDGCVRR